jgi:hypothetical protein
MGGGYSTCGEVRNIQKIVVGEPERKRSHGRPGDRWENNVKNLKEISWRAWTGFIVARDRRKWQTPHEHCLIFRFHKRQGLP